MTISSAFRQTAEAVQRELADMEFRDRFIPPTSPSGIPYNCLLIGVDGDVGVDKQSGDAFSFARLTFRILHGDFQDRSFSCYYRTTWAWNAKALFDLAAALTKDPSYVEDKKFVEATESLVPFIDRAIVEMMGFQDGQYSRFEFSRLIEVEDAPTAPL